MIVEALEKVLGGASLTAEEMSQAMEEMISGSASAAQIGAFLVALRMKGESVTELVGAAQTLRGRVERISVRQSIFVDTCGTGGDGQHTFNISTGAAIVVAAAGVAVAKHGNRSVSSRCGSADVLAALGVNIDAPLDAVERSIQQAGIGFLFAPKLHPAFKAVAPVRRELKVRTIFNLLGPLVSPAQATRQVVGVFAPKWVPLIAEALRALSAEHALVVHGGGLDELSVCGPSQLAEVQVGAVRTFEVTPEELGLRRWDAAGLAGGGAEDNARILRDIFGGQAGGPREAVIANAAAGLLVGRAVSTLSEGVRRAAEAIDRGWANEKLDALVRLSRGGAA